MKTLVIYHNPACSNSRRALELLRERGADFEIVEYLKNPPGREVLEGLVANLELPARGTRAQGQALRGAGP